MKSPYWIKQLAGSLIFFAIIFLSAGTLHYWQGWVFTAIGLAMMLLQNTALRMDKELLSERSKPGEGTKSWDKKILGLSFLVTLAMYIIAGLDSGRFHWSPGFPSGLYAAGIVLTITGQLLFLVAQKQNKFFSSTVRIQTDRQHQVCDTGLYKLIRHPAYLGNVVQALGFPLLFGSLWSIIPAVFMVILVVIRTMLEDKTLMHELKGYPEYCNKTEYRMIPFIW